MGRGDGCLPDRTKYEWTIIVVYFLEGFACVAMIVMNQVQKDLAGPNRTLYTLIIEITSLAGAIAGLACFASWHGEHFFGISVIPWVNLVFIVLWCVNFGLYATFLGSDSDIVAGYIDMKAIVWTSVAHAVLWFIITLVSFIDWREHGDHGEYIQRPGPSYNGPGGGGVSYGGAPSYVDGGGGYLP